MTHKEFLKEYIRPHIKKNDKPFNRQLYNDTKDALHKDGLITDKQVNTWVYPNTLYYSTNLKKNVTIPED